MVKKGLWSPEEDEKLRYSIAKYVNGSWNDIAQRAGLQRCGRSCRQRWLNHLRPGLKKGKFSIDEIKKVLELHAKLGNKWCEIAAQLDGRTDNEVKNLWNTVLKQRSHNPYMQRPSDADDHDHGHRHHPCQIRSENRSHQSTIKEDQIKYSASHSVGKRNGVIKYVDRCSSVIGTPPSSYIAQLPLPALSPTSPLMASSSSSSSSILPDFASPPPRTAISWSDSQMISGAAHLHNNIDQITPGQQYSNHTMMPALRLVDDLGTIPNIGSDHNRTHASQQFPLPVLPYDASILTSPAGSSVDITSVPLGGTNHVIQQYDKYKEAEDIGHVIKLEELNHLYGRIRFIDPHDDDEGMTMTSSSPLDHLLAHDCLTNQLLY